MPSLQELKDSIDIVFRSDNRTRINVLRNFFKNLIDAILDLQTGISNIVAGPGAVVTIEDGVAIISMAGETGGNYKTIISDADFQVLKGFETVDPDNYMFMLSPYNGESIVWTVGNTTYTVEIEEQWRLEVDKLGSGVEKRIDVVYYGANGEISYIKGNELGQTNYPSIGNNDILKTFVIITPEGIETVASLPVTQDSEKWYSWNTDSNNYDTVIGTNVSTRYRKIGIIGSAPDNLRFTAIQRNGTQNFWDGMEFAFWNDSPYAWRMGDDIPVIQNGEYFNFHFNLGNDYVVQPGEVVKFKMDMPNLRLKFILSNEIVKYNKKIQIAGVWFEYFRKPDNNSVNILEGELAYGGWVPNGAGGFNFIKWAMYTGTGNPTNIENWVILDEWDFRD